MAKGLSFVTWNGAAGDKKYSKKVRPDKALQSFSKKKIDACLLQESSMTPALLREASTMGLEHIKGKHGTAILYRSAVLTPVGDTKCGTMTACKGNRPGTAVTQAFQVNSTGEYVVITSVHAGHYYIKGRRVRRGKVNKHAMKTAMNDIKQKCVKPTLKYVGDRFKQKVAKIIVGGDFNEMGAYLQEHRSDLCPVPLGASRQSWVGNTSADGKPLDHIFVGGPSVRNPGQHGKKGRTYESDHNSVMMFDV